MLVEIEPSVQIEVGARVVVRAYARVHYRYPHRRGASALGQLDPHSQQTLVQIDNQWSTSNTQWSNKFSLSLSSLLSSSMRAGKSVISSFKSSSFNMMSWGTIDG